MDEQRILISKNGRTVPVGGSAPGRADVLAGWTGLRLVRYQPPAEATNRHILGAHPALTLLCHGEMESHIRVGLRNLHTQLRANDLMFYSGGKELAYAHWQARGATLISVEFDPARLNLLEPGDTRFSERCLTGQPRFSDVELGALLQALWLEGHAGGPRGPLFADSLCLGLALRVYQRFGPGLADAADGRARLSHSQLRRVEDYITEHLDQNIGLADLAQEAGLSRFHFTRVFSNTLGHSPYQHVIRKRLERAYQLLMSSELSVADVALSVGFSSQAHFSALCRRELGATPRSLREQG